MALHCPSVLVGEGALRHGVIRAEDQGCALGVCPAVQGVKRVALLGEENARPAITRMPGRHGCDHGGGLRRRVDDEGDEVAAHDARE